MGKQNEQTDKANSVCSEGGTFPSSSYTAGPSAKGQNLYALKGLFPSRVVCHSGFSSRNCEKSPPVLCSFILTVHDALCSANEPSFNRVIDAA